MSESDMSRRQILISRVDPLPVRVKMYKIQAYKQKTNFNKSLNSSQLPHNFIIGCDSAEG